MRKNRWTKAKKFKFFMDIAKKVRQSYMETGFVFAQVSCNNKVDILLEPAEFYSLFGDEEYEYVQETFDNNERRYVQIVVDKYYRFYAIVSAYHTVRQLEDSLK